MKCKLLTLFSLALFITHPVFADTNIQCPSLAALKSVGVVDAHDLGQYFWIVSNRNHYDTPQEWSFFLLINANDKNDAIIKGNAAIAGFSKVEGPKQDHKQFSCTYRGKPGQYGIAETPPVMNAPVSIKR